MIKGFRLPRDKLHHLRLSAPLILALAVYFGLLLPTLTRQGISWDEQTDLEISRAYLQPAGWLKGSPLDPSQTRLPHASVALVYHLTSTDDLLTARLVSAMAGAVTLAGVYLLGKRLFTPAAGWIAALLLASSPFYLSFARVAFTETDIYLACAVIWLLLALERLRQQPTLGRAALAGLLLGMAISAKFTTLTLLPVVGYTIYLSKHADPSSRLASAPPWQAGVAAILPGGLAIGGCILARFYPSGEGIEMLRFPLFILLLAGWLAVLTWLAWRHRQTTSPFLLATLVVNLALLTFLLAPPDHLTNPAILNSLASRFAQEMRFNPAFVGEAAGLHLLSILFKSSPLAGLGLLCGWGFALARARRPELRIPLLTSLGYSAGLLLLPLAQTFYMIPILPILAVFLGDGISLLVRLWRFPSLVLVGGIALVLAVDLAACYPDYNLNGYQWLGNRTLLGRSTIGYRSVVQTPSDGVEQVINWLNQHAASGEQVTSYLLEEHILKALAPNPPYRIIYGIRKESRPTTDYVLTEINTDIAQSWWTRPISTSASAPLYDAAWLEDQYTRVFSVQRAFGITMAAVWKRK
ncbi:MAG TPA: glycosyltransferase family 39 protein [Anaerolineaceae bacterium]